MLGQREQLRGWFRIEGKLVRVVEGIDQEEIDGLMEMKGPEICKSKCKYRASLVAQWLRICLPMQGTRVRALVWEDPTCCGATRPMSHNY